MAPLPYAQLNIFRPERGPGPTDAAPTDAAPTDAAYVSSRLGMDGMQGPLNRGWFLTTEGRVQSHSATPHVDELLRVLSGKSEALERLRAEGYWVCVFFHDTRPPDSGEVSAVTAALEARNITFDFELERS